jgi:exodeoxyribonuclease VII small subunit
MENDDLTLEQLLKQYEEGNALAQVCQTKLAEAELKVEQLEKSHSGEMTLKPVETSPE